MSICRLGESTRSKNASRRREKGKLKRLILSSSMTVVERDLIFIQLSKLLKEY